jgi:UDP-N-acetylmuramoyl-tripeptide--D-alanyl-D-alanine ligase
MHLALGRKCPENRVDWLIAVQGDAKFLVDGAVQAGLSPNRTRFFATPEDAAEYCGAMLEPGDVVLVKGSRGVHLEKVVDLLRAGSPEPKGAPFTPPRG